MRAGKSMLLLREAEKLELSKKSYVLVRPRRDTREFMARSFSPSLGLNITKDYSVIDKYENILLDEFHLFEDEFVEKILDLSINKKIIISGLCNGTNDLNKPLNIEVLKNILKVLPFSEEIIKLNAICESCGSEYANYVTTEKITISDNYKVLCRKCRSKIG